MNIGMNSDEMMPPATSSKIMFGMLFATLYADMRPVAPSANAVAQMRRKPVTRDSMVSVDIIAVERAMDGLLMADASGSGDPASRAARGQFRPRRAARTSVPEATARRVAPRHAVRFGAVAVAVAARRAVFAILASGTFARDAHPRARTGSP